MTDDDLTITLSDDDAGLGALLDQRIYEFNVASTGADDGRALAVRATTAEGVLAAGLSGWTWSGCGYVDVLWVAVEHRGRGLGSRLLALAEDEARARGCTVMALSTHSFQAPDFYAARGYLEVGRTDGYPAGHSQHHLRKDLGPTPAP